MYTFICADYVVHEKPTSNSLLPVIPHLAAKWYNLGLSLGAKDFTLNNIKETQKDDCEKCCQEMLQNWCNGKTDCGARGRPVTWETLLCAVESAINSETSTYIRREVLKLEDRKNTLERGSSESCTIFKRPASPCCDVFVVCCEW